MARKKKPLYVGQLACHCKYQGQIGKRFEGAQCLCERSTRKGGNITFASSRVILGHLG